MIDVHAHILYGIDDGAKTIEESVAILKQMSHLGYTKVIATPHYIDNTRFVANNRTKKEILANLRERLQEEHIPVELYLGNEIFIDDDLEQKMAHQEIHTLNNTNYILLELPMVEKLELDLDIIYELIRKGVKVVLAHPERYVIFQRNEDLIEKYTELGVLLQGNVDSLTGKYGKEAQKLFIKLLKKRKYFVLGSDIHHVNSSFFQNFINAKKKMIHYTDESYIEDLFVKHPEFILMNKEIETVEV